jgi:uncharacterized protein
VVDANHEWPDDPVTAPFWSAAREGALLVQRCDECGAYQFYPRPYCLRCFSANVSWVSARGTGTVYSMTTVRIHVLPELSPPYRVAVVELEEGPRLTTNLVGPDCRIGDAVRVTWRDRGDLPPVPVFEPIGGEADAAT